MSSLQSILLPSIYQAFVHTASPPQLALRRNGSSLVRAEQQSSASPTISSQVSRRVLLAIGGSIPSVLSFTNAPLSFAAESKKGFLPVMDKKDGYTFYYPFGWQEVVIEGQDKVFKDVIEPLENVSVNLIPTNKQDIKDFGPPEEVAETLIKKVLAPPNQKTKLIQAKQVPVFDLHSFPRYSIVCQLDFLGGATVGNDYEKGGLRLLLARHTLRKKPRQEVDGKIYYTFEFVSQARNYTRHALSAICIANGKFYTLTTGANERRWEKMKDRLTTVVDSFRVFNV